MITKVFPIISGYGAKTICSNIFLCGRLPNDIIQKELGAFPLNLGRYTIDKQEKSVTGTVRGMAKRKAIYREGLGATLMIGVNEQELIEQASTIEPRPVINSSSENWANGISSKTTVNAGINTKQLNAALDEAFDDAEGERGTRAVVVLYEGEIIAERYANGFSRQSKLAGWSMAKSITSALIGILVKQNKLQIDAPAPIKEWKNDERRNITIANLLQMSSGLNWWEYYAAPSDATNMLYREKEMGRFALHKKLQHPPGSKFYYSSGSTNILSYIIRQVVGEANYYRFPYEQLFHKIGMNDTVLEVDAGGTFAASSYCFATALDWAKFGLLYLQDGVWNGERILPVGWVNFTTTPTTAKTTKKEGSYGAQWWLNKATIHAPKKYPLVPDDCFRCQGYEGQYVWVIPSEKLVVVRLALEKGNELDPNTFLPAVISACKDPK
ncbi:serine hydrolase domain-containing protein [Segetibacter aerophilus]|uniref:Serine hydrolase n=1 Tax=Segetibacter aerophilus TaxID=670293 RepID=A0A512B7H4_9BACT|nr:serine hydrolase [Segetibacter aerophilus]GEO07913.1 serine hydrolase [Segetibacter aerophilus]